jgi:hypothetical protein
MAQITQQEVMEQVKQFIRLCIKYRFWISIGVAALFAVVAYVAGSRPVRAQAEDETRKIKGAESEVKKYASSNIPTADYKPIVVEKTEILTNDVNSAWKTLYDRQKDLLTWPEAVEKRFKKWGRKWPEGEDSGKVQFAKIDYIEAFPEYVTKVYQCFKPFNYETGEGIVVAPPEPVLLRAPHFIQEDLPELGKIWATQERLWVQRGVLEVVAQVNKNASEWDGAIVKEIDELQVGVPVAQDQRSLAKNETLDPAPAITNPAEPVPDTSAASATAGAAGIGGMMRGMMGMGGRRGGEMGGGMSGGFGPAQTDELYYVKSETDKGQYKILPILVTILIDQDRVQDFLVELENSPMSIQVMDFELKRPSSRVVKPEKGTSAFGGLVAEGGMGSMMGGMGAMGQMMMRMSRGGMGMGGRSGYGGEMGMMQGMMMNRMRGMQGGMSMMGGLGGGVAEKKGKDVRGADKKKKREAEEKAAAEARGPMLFDPHFDIVQVTVYGQARLFLPPPVEESAPPSPGQATLAVDAPAGAAPADTATGAAKPAGGGPAAPGAAKTAGTSAPSAQESNNAADTNAEGAAKAEPPQNAKPARPRAPGAAKPDAAKAAGPAAGPSVKPETKKTSDAP